MIKQIDKIFKNPLFKGINKDIDYEVLEVLGTQLKNYSKDQYVFKAGKKIKRAAILIEGKVVLTRENYWKEESIVQEVKPGELFALSVSTNSSISTDINAKCLESSVILWFHTEYLFMHEETSKYHSIIVKNLLSILAKQYIELKAQVWNISQDTIRNKLLSYLSLEASQKHTNEFDIPFNRQELANHLCVDRSALSTELNKLQKEGYFIVKKNHFTLLSK